MLKVRNPLLGILVDVAYWLYTKMPEGSVWEVYFYNLTVSLTKKGGLKDE